jgi:hypothetical protein
MRKYHVQLTNPVIELVLKAKDIAGEQAELIVGFKRKSIKEAQFFAEHCDKITNAPVGPKGTYPVEIVSFETSEQKEEHLKQLVKGEVLYLKDVELTCDEGPEFTIKIPDTRTVPNGDYQELWGDNTKCLDFLLDIYLTSAPWSSAFISALYSISLNLDFGNDAEVKNS